MLLISILSRSFLLRESELQVQVYHDAYTYYMYVRRDVVTRTQNAER